MREHAARRGRTIAMQIREPGSGTAQREADETLLESARQCNKIDGHPRNWL